MEFLPLPIPGAYEIKLSPFKDDRGEFSRLFSKDEWKNAGLDGDVVQINQSLNYCKGTIRGMHFQYAPFSETKIIRCTGGRVLDVMVDLRTGSPGFLKWHAVELAPAAHNMIYIPKGCAHGFQALEDNSELLYLHTEFYHPKAEGAIRFNDPLIGIQWPLAPVNVSEKDQNYPLLDQSYNGIAVQ